MTPFLLTVELFAVSLAAGVFGALMGMGGGLVLVPALTLLFGVDIRYAVGASIVSVIATSSGAAATYVREGLTNMRVALFLEMGTTAGALTGALLAGLLHTDVLFLLFGAAIGGSAVAMLWRLGGARAPEGAADALAERLQLHGSYYDSAEGGLVSYRVRHTQLGLGLMYVAGILSGLLGIGSGALKVPAMDLAMGLPVKVSTATSNFMIGVTAAASAGVYFVRGDINPFIAGPVCAGVTLGAMGGTRLLGRLRSSTLRGALILVLLWMSFQMLRRGLS
jgi:uncharacterized membrane protein YfcA